MEYLGTTSEGIHKTGKKTICKIWKHPTFNFNILRLNSRFQPFTVLPQQKLNAIYLKKVYL